MAGKKVQTVTTATKETVPVEAPPAPAPAPVAVEVAPVVDAPATEDSYQAKYESVLSDLANVSNVVKNLQATVKVLLKEYNKVVKSSGKRGRKAPSTKPRTPSGFAKPAKLSKELCDFLGIPEGSERARTDVTRMLNEYIKKHNLQDSTDKRKIVPNAELRKIMNLKDGDVLSYFNMQTYIKHHFNPKP